MIKSHSSQQPLLGFIGQGFIGKNYADDFERRGFVVVRFSLEEPYIKNRDQIGKCDIVFIAVPTPTTPSGFDDRIVREAVKLVGLGKTAIIKSTVLPGVTESIQKENPDIFVLHSPEFLSETTAVYDAAHPVRNIVGIAQNTDEQRRRAQLALDIFPKAPYNKICTALEAEIIKYSRNCLGYTRVVFANILYDLSQAIGADWEVIREAVAADPDNGTTYLRPVEKKRGAGGNCFIKDFAAFSQFHRKIVDNPLNQKVLDSLEEKNIDLLRSTGKDLNILKGVYEDNEGK